MKKILAYLLLLSFLIISLSACGSSADMKPAPAPTPLLVQLRADAGNKQVTLDWQMVANADTYNIYVGTSASSLTKITTVPAPLPSAPYTVTALSNGTSLANGVTYYFAITAVNASVESALSGAISATPKASPPPAAPENVRANAGDLAVTVTWTTVADAANGYKLYCYWVEGLTVGIGAAITIPLQTTNSSLVTLVTWTAGPDAGHIIGLTNGRTYNFYVTAVNASGEGNPSFIVTATPSTTPPPFAPVLTTAAPGSTEVTLTWDTVPGATSYNIYVGTAKGVTKATGLQFPDQASGNIVAGLTNEVEYYFVVTAVNANGESAESNEMSATPTAGP